MKPPLRILAVLFALTLTFGSGSSAPVPPPPRVSEELLSGAVWHWTWGGMSDGLIALGTDGTYYCYHGPPHGPCFAGQWWVMDGRLVLEERAFWPETGRMSDCSRRYEIELTVASGPVLTGHHGDTRVALRDPKR